MQNFNPLSHLRATQALRATMGSNPYHNQHIAEFTACMDEAMTFQGQYIDAVVRALTERITFLEKRVEELEQAQKQPAAVEAHVVLNEKSAKNVRKRIMDLLKW